MLRIGHGFDVHAFGGDGPVTIGGVKIPYEKGLIAHSDGDVLLHALTDAMLGAAALGDIGKLFPDSSDEFLGIDSRILLRRAAALLRETAGLSRTAMSRSSPRPRRWRSTSRRWSGISRRT